MKFHTCEKCGKEFSKKSHYTAHINKKKPCDIYSKITENLVEITKEINIQNKFVKDINIKKFNIPKPILKWVGGKTQIITEILNNFPKSSLRSVTDVN